MTQQTLVSIRDIALITQEVKDVPQLTMENYMKWYTMYLIQPNGTVVNVNEIMNDSDAEDEEGRTWYDHCPTPAHFHAVAKYLEATYDNETFSAVCVRFVKDILDNDWTKLSEYLPKRKDDN